MNFVLVFNVYITLIVDIIFWAFLLVASKHIKKRYVKNCTSNKIIIII